MLRNKMEDEFLTNYLLVYIEKKITEKFSIILIIYYFHDMHRETLHILIYC